MATRRRRRPSLHSHVAVDLVADVALVELPSSCDAGSSSRRNGKPGREARGNATYDAAFGESGVFASPAAGEAVLGGYASPRGSA